MGESAACEGAVAEIFLPQIRIAKKGGARGFFDKGGEGAPDQAEQVELAELWLNRAMVPDGIRTMVSLLK